MSVTVEVGDQPPIDVSVVQNPAIDVWVEQVAIEVSTAGAPGPPGPSGPAGPTGPAGSGGGGVDTGAQRDLKILSAVTYGAVGDDTTDSTAGIQAAIDAAGEGGIVYLPKGKYRVTAPLILKKGVTLSGSHAPRWSYFADLAPQSYIKPRSTFVGTAVIKVLDKEEGGYAIEQGNQRIIDVCVDGSAMATTALTDGVLVTGLIRDFRMQNVSLRYLPGKGLRTAGYTRADTLTRYPRGLELSHVVADTCDDFGFLFNVLTDSILFDCLAVGNKGDGFYISGSGENQLIGCRSVFNRSGHGFHLLGCSNGGTVLSGCSTDRNDWDGLRIECTGFRPILVSGMSLRRDGRNGDGGGGGYAGLRIDGATCPIVVSGLTVEPGQNDDNTGLYSPESAVKVGNATHVQLGDAMVHGFVNSIVDLGGNGIFDKVEVRERTGSPTAPVPVAYDPIAKASEVAAATGGVKIVTGLWGMFWSYASSGTVSMAANQMRLTRVYLRQPADRLAFEVTTGAAGAQMVVAVYADGAAGPGPLVTASSAADAATTGVKVMTMAVPTGWYWIGVQNVTAVTTAQVRIIGSTNPYSPAWDTPGAGAVPGSGWVYDAAGTTPPANVGALTNRNSSVPALYFRAA